VWSHNFKRGGTYLAHVNYHCRGVDPEIGLTSAMQTFDTAYGDHKGGHILERGSQRAIAPAQM